MNENIIGILILALALVSCLLWLNLRERSDKLDEKEHDIFLLKGERAKLQDELDKMVKIIDEMRKNKESTPEDCSLGPWCQSCAWVKRYYRFISLKEGGIYDFYCGKAEACEHFQPGKQEDVEE